MHFEQSAPVALTTQPVDLREQASARARNLYRMGVLSGGSELASAGEHKKNGTNHSGYNCLIWIA